MKGFLDKLQNKNNKKGEFKNPFAAKKNHQRGGGQSLGGSKPGKIISISIPAPGPIGVILENTQEGSAIIASVADGSQAQLVGLRRGDVILFQDSNDSGSGSGSGSGNGNGNGNGKDEIPYKIFLEMVKSDTLRPLNFDIRRIESSAAAASSNNSAHGTSSHGSSGGIGIRADEQARRQAVIAAAEARDKQNKFKKKPLRKGSELTTEQKKKLQLQKDALEIKNASQLSNAPMTDESKKAVEYAKKNEVMHAQELGYNPYETMKGTGQQGSSAVTSLNHGTMDAGPGASGSGSGGGSKGSAAKSKSTNVNANSQKKPSSSLQMQAIDPTFDEAFATLITTNENNEAIIKSLRIMRKLIINATAGEEGQPQQSQEKKRVRISNPNKHIEAAIHHTEGALDLMMSVGFVILELEEDSETYLMYQYQSDVGTEFGVEEFPKWLKKALKQMEEYEINL